MFVYTLGDLMGLAWLLLILLGCAVFAVAEKIAERRYKRRNRK